MRLLFIGPLPEPVTGQALACRVFLEAIPDGFQVEVIDLSKRQLKQGFDSFARAREVARILWRVARTQRRTDAIYLTVSESGAGNLKDLLIYAICCRRLPHMVIHLLGGTNMRRILGESGLRRRLNVFFLQRLGGVVVEGRTQAAMYREIIRPERLHVVPNFAEDALFATAADIDAKFAVPPPLRILFLSNLLPGKGHDELVDAVLALDPGTRSAIEVHMAGAFESDAQRDAFLGRIADVGEIHYHGVVDGPRKRELLSRAHVFCLPTYYPYEGQPFVILEAYASGCAVITTNHAGIGDVFQDQVNGIEVKKQSVPSLRAAIERAAADPDGLRRMATANLSTAQAQYRAARYGQALVRIVERAAQAI